MFLDATLFDSVPFGIVLIVGGGGGLGGILIGLVSLLVCW